MVNEIPISPQNEKEQMLMNACKKHAKNTNLCFDTVNGIFIADSSCGTKGAGANNNNPGNVRPGSGKYGDHEITWIRNHGWRKYKTLKDGVYDNVAIYAQLYEGSSLLQLANAWAEGSINWRYTVQKSINKYYK